MEKDEIVQDYRIIICSPASKLSIMLKINFSDINSKRKKWYRQDNHVILKQYPFEMKMGGAKQYLYKDNLDTLQSVSQHVRTQNCYTSLQNKNKNNFFKT